MHGRCLYIRLHPRLRLYLFLMSFSLGFLVSLLSTALLSFFIHPIAIGGVIHFTVFGFLTMAITEAYGN